MRVALYVRVSTAEQTADNQLPALTELAGRLGVMTGEVERFTDVASGKNVAGRPQLLELVGQARRFDVVLIWSLDRLGRNLLEVLNLLEQLRAAGVRVVSYREPWLDTSSPTSSLLTAILAWVAEFERAQLVARTNAGIARARAAGKQIGRPRVKVTPAQAEHFVRLNSGSRNPARRVAMQLGISEETVRRLLKKHRSDAAAAAPASKPRPAG